MLPSVRALRFPFPFVADADVARATITTVLNALPAADPIVLQATIDQTLVDRFGVWISGWSWAASSGGLVRAYCCPAHSLKGSKEEITGVVMRAITEWHTTLSEITSLFAGIAEQTRDLPLERVVEHAAAAILPFVITRNTADEAWYGAFTDVLTWCLDSIGLDRDVFAQPLDDVVSGRFRSWAAPDADTAAKAAEEMGLAVALAEPREHDALAEWRDVRDKAFASLPQAWKVPLTWDGHARFIEKDADPVRRDRMRRALADCRASSKRPLDLALLTRWQRIVLDDDAIDFRTTDAFAKNGRERYGFDEQTKGRFARWLADANDPQIPVTVRAARVYLDICFTHPFPDGNARAARLAMDHVLTREGLMLRAVEPLFVLSRSAADFRGAWTLVWLVGYLAGSIETITSPT